MGQETWIQIAVPAVIVLLLTLFVWLSIRAKWRQRLIDNIPTSKVAGVFMGLVEVKGSAEAERPLRSYLAETRCVYYTYSIEEHWRRTVTETYTDKDGHTRTRTRTESGWKTVDSGGDCIAFYLRDDTGVLLIHPDGAEIEASEVFDETCGRSDPLYYGKGPAHSVANSTHRRRFVERAICLHAPIYVMGRARERRDIVAPEIADDERAPIFLISTRSEEQISRGHAIAFWLWFLLALAGAALGAWGINKVVTGADDYPVGFGLGAAGGLFGVWLVAWAWMVFNSMVDLKNRVNRAWSLIDVELKRRHDLIPRLVNVVRGFKDYEKNLQTELATLRSQAGATAPGEPGADPAACQRALIGIVENYPELKSNELFLELQKELIQTEQRIALARAYFNDSVTQNNNRLETVPDSFFARLAGMKTRKWMEAADFERAPVKVNLSD